jgi:4-hydroxybenzoate polyprenyltransferase
MGSRPVVTLSPGARPRWHAYLLLARISNLPTVWTNVAAGMVAANGAALDLSLYGRIAAAASCFYIGGMLLNDAFDAHHDAQVRPERPIPAGDVTRREVFAVGGALLLLGLASLPATGTVLLVGAALTLGILVYDYHHKGSRIAPLIMGGCRGLLYLLAAAAAGWVSPAAWMGAGVMAAYVTWLTLVGRVAGRHAAILVPALIAGISLVDALFIAGVTRALAPAFVVGLACPLTLLLQRVIPGD